MGERQALHRRCWGNGTNTRKERSQTACLPRRQDEMKWVTDLNRSPKP